MSKGKVLRNTPRKSQAPRGYDESQTEAYNLKSRVSRYFNQFDDLNSALESAIYDVADPKSVVYTKPIAKSPDSDPLADNLQFTGGENGKAVLEWAKQNLSSETNTQINERLATVKKNIKSAEKGIIKKDQAKASDAAQLAKRKEDESLQILTPEAQENADIEAAEAQEALDTEGRVETTRANTADKRARKKKVSKRKSAQESADANFVKIIRNDKVDYTSTNNKGILTATAKRNVERAESYANASSDPEVNLKLLAEVLAKKRFEAKKAKAEAAKKTKKARRDAKKVSDAEANLDARKEVKPTPKTTKQKIIDAAVEKFTKIKGITREDVLAAYSMVTQDLSVSSRESQAKKYFDTATPENIRESAKLYKRQKELEYDLLELDVDVAATMDTNLPKGVRELLSKGDLPGAMRALMESSANKRVKQIIRALSSSVEGVNVEVVNTKDLESIGIVARTDDNIVAGAYDSESNTIFINSDVAPTGHTLLHETTHAATVGVLDNPSHPTTKKLQKLFDDLQGSMQAFPNITNLREFVAEAFSNPEFQLRLSEIDVKGKRYTALRAFYDAITNLVRSAINRVSGANLQLSGSALKATDQAILSILPVNADTRGISVLNELALESVSGSGVTTSPLAQAIARNIQANPKSRQQWLLDIRNTLFDVFELAKTPTKTALGALDLQTLGDVARKTKFGQLGYDLLELINKQRADLTRSAENVDKVVTQFRNWASSVDSKLVDSYNTLIYSTQFGATLYGVDPEIGTTANPEPARTKYEGKVSNDGKDLFEVWLSQREHWDALGTEGQKQFRTQRKMYKQMYDDLLDVIFGQIDVATGVNKELNAKMKERVYRELASKGELDVYFPLVREGKHKVSYSINVTDENGRTTKQPVFLMFETKREARAAQFEAGKEAIDGKVEYFNGNFNKDAFNSAPSGSLVAEVLQLLKNNGVDDTVSTEVMQLFVSALPESSFAKSMQGRNNVFGFIPNTDVALRKKGYSLAAQIVKLRGSAKINAIKEKINEAYTKPYAGDNQWQSESLREYVLEELIDRATFSVQGTNFKGLDTLAKRLNQIAFIYTIGFNASSALVNMSQIGLFIIPNLAPRFGLDATWAAFTKASKYVGSSMARIDKDYDVKEVRTTRDDKTVIELQVTLKNATRKDILGLAEGDPSSMSKDDAQAKVDELERNIPIIKLALEQGLVNTTVDMDVAAVADNKGEAPKTTAEKLRSLTSWGEASAFMFNFAEKFNRQTTLLGSYDLVLQQMESNKKVYSKLQSKFVAVPSSTAAKREMAAREAAYITHETNGGATLETTPRLIRAGIGRIAGMYKSFGLRMWSTMIKSFADIFREAGRTKTMSKAELREIRTLGAKQLANVFVSSSVFAGIQGVPIYGLIAMISDLFTDEDETKFRASTLYELSDLFSANSKYGQMLYKGPVSYFSGVDVSNRVGLSNLLLSDNRYLRDPAPEELMFLYLAGPSGSTLKKMIRAVEDIKKGNIQRGVEQLIPTGFSNLLKVLPYGRLYEDRGYYTRGYNGERGQLVSGNLTGKDLLMSGLGFPSLESALQSESNSRMKRQEIGITTRRKEILAAHTGSVINGDTSGMVKARERIMEFNADHPDALIDKSALLASVKGALNKGIESVNGINLDPRLRERLLSIEGLGGTPR